MNSGQFTVFRHARAFAVGLCLLAAGCGGAPYIHMEGEFNRAREGFGQAPQDITDVTVCYSGLETTAKAVADMAGERCAAFGKTAVFESQNMTVCPALTPTAANFRCVKQNKAADKNLRKHPEEG